MLKYNSTENLRYNSLSDEIIRTIQYAFEKQKLNYDRTYKSVIKEITINGYVVLDKAGSNRTVKCCIPGLQLEIGQSVWVKEPMGDIRYLHICGVA